MDAIVVDALTKTYRVKVGRARIREAMPWPFDVAVSRLFPRWWVRDTFNALEDVSLRIAAGTAVGLVGHNGAGKTTLLKVISRVTEPTRGHSRVSGRVAALIDALVGFHPDLTGRENVYLLASMHGIGRKTMASRLDQVLAFAEVQGSADTPLKRYSAGMAARLGFATITALGVEVLLIDEVLAVGDAMFQRKCIRWLDEYRASGGTLLFVSHNLALVRSMTERVVWLAHGQVVGDGPTADVLADYVRAMEQREAAGPVHRRRDAQRVMVAEGAKRWGAGGARVHEVHIEETSLKGEGLQVGITYGSDGLDRGIFCVGFVDEGGHEIGATISPAVALSGESGSIRCTIRPLPLRSGIYFPVVAIVSPDGLVRDRWKLDRAVVVDRNGDVVLPDTFGPVEISGDWSDR
jgi:lipopolysaccharide transport system ATP-binding protein